MQLFPRYQFAWRHRAAAAVCSFIAVAPVSGQQGAAPQRRAASAVNLRLWNIHPEGYPVTVALQQFRGRRAGKDRQPRQRAGFLQRRAG